MPGLIRHSDIDEVKARTNIADVIGEYVSLKPAGIGSLKGLCPFHDERSPSFNVRPQLGFYHCFGCNESGDVYKFIQTMDHVPFAEAVERLAARIGYQLSYEDGGNASEDRGTRARILAANKAAEEFYTARLTAPDAEPGRRFLGERGFDAAAAARFGVGYAPKSWDELTNHLKGRGFSLDELAAAGLVSQNDRGGAYDRFRGRVVWPIRDVTGTTLGFGARRLFDDDNGPKYLNTPETAVFHKAQVLYGLDIAKRDVSKGKQVVVVEGYTDVMACHLAGITTAVATCGTAFGADHVRLLRRVLGDEGGEGQVVFTFDPDAAGQKAAERSFTVLQEQRIAAQTYVAVGPDGLDPCDLRLAKGDQSVVQMIADKKPMFEFMLRQVVARFDLDTVEGRVGALRAGAPIVAGIRDPALRPGYTRELARMTGAELSEAQSAVRAFSNRARQATDAAPQLPTETVTLADLGRDPITTTERQALMAVLQLPEAVGRDLVGRAVQARFSNPTLELVKSAVAANVDAFGAADWFARIRAELPDQFRPIVEQLALSPIPERSEEAAKVWAKAIVGSLIEKDMVTLKAELQSRLQRTDPSDSDSRIAISRAMAELELERRRLRGE
ncbi:DNA primase [Gryllotalpicola protaetiae]|uniref:DNA primase n=1 Tax=Gryllotalpicola protaetiae TaxID=2419771 RepID=A0A387BLN0_9MICO|nr:DNA primase [Gryllotalpicola protaetiae]AYG05065.1 DNA primase [Gryllotalpicola protaetiae]